MNLLRHSFAILAVLTLVFAGCGDTTDKKDKEDTKKTAQKKDDHAHHHAHGPNKGSHFIFEDAEDFSGEVVTYGENDLVKIMFCDIKGKKTVSLKAEKVCIVRKIGDKETVFDLEAISSDDDGNTDGFELEDKDLKVAISVGPVNVKATIDGKEYTGTAHPHNH